MSKSKGGKGYKKNCFEGLVGDIVMIIGTFVRIGMTVHHKISRNGKEVKGSNHEDNLILIKAKIHEALHTLFENCSIRQQFIKLLRINQKALNKDFVIEFIALLRKYKYDFYNKNCTRR